MNLKQFVQLGINLNGIPGPEINDRVFKLVRPIRPTIWKTWETWVRVPHANATMQQVPELMVLGDRGPVRQQFNKRVMLVRGIVQVPKLRRCEVPVTTLHDHDNIHDTVTRTNKLLPLGEESRICAQCGLQVQHQPPCLRCFDFEFLVRPSPQDLQVQVMDC